MGESADVFFHLLVLDAVDHMSGLQDHPGDPFFCHLGEGFFHSWDDLPGGPGKFLSDHAAGPGLKDRDVRPGSLDLLFNGLDGPGAGGVVAGAEADHKDSGFLIHDVLLFLS